MKVLLKTRNKKNLYIFSQKKKFFFLENLCLITENFLIKKLFSLKIPKKYKRMTSFQGMLIAISETFTCHSRECS